MIDPVSNEEKYDILATSDRAPGCTRVLKEGETFAIFDCHGDVQATGFGEQGIFHEGTRFLSRSELRFGGVRPLLLGSTINGRNELLAIDLMNPDIFVDGRHIHRDSIHIFRTKFLWKGTCHEQLRLTNFSLHRLQLPFTISFAADFADIFEVRGMKRHRRGTVEVGTMDGAELLMRYRGLDRVTRTTRITFTLQPKEISDATASFEVDLEPKESITICISIACECPECERAAGGYVGAFRDAQRSLEMLGAGFCGITTDNEYFNSLLARSRTDLIMMTSRTPHGLYPYAGVPWFSTPFGRDGIITALETLWANPDLARGVLSYLAATQADRVDPEKDAEPGKILHETRMGEMAALGEIPFGSYYGSVDSTPLFVVLAGAYHRQTGDRDFISSIWGNVTRALEWIDTYGDADGDGFVEYARHSREGLVQQGWKDSNDSVFHADGTLAEPPIALCEVQGYVYAAKLLAAEMATTVGEEDRALDLARQAEQLRRNFVRDFWCEDLGFYALALDGRKRPCRVRSSNVGHCLFSGIAAPEHAAAIAGRLLSDEFFTGWGIRTLGSGERRYNPMSYHNGSIWPHDNAIIASGLVRYGHRGEAVRLLHALFEASLAMDLHRLPELFCGFKRRGDLSPILYPVACAPQAWAAGSVFLMLQGCIGLSVQGGRHEVRFTHPVLPPFLNEVSISGIRVSVDRSVDVVLKRYGDDVAVTVVRKEGRLEVVIVK